MSTLPVPPEIGNFESDYLADSIVNNKNSQKDQNTVDKYSLTMHSKIIVPALQMLYDGKNDTAVDFLNRCIVPMLKQPSWSRNFFLKVLNASLQGLEKKMANEILDIITNIYYRVRPVFTLKF